MLDVLPLNGHLILREPMERDDGTESSMHG